MQYIPPFPHFYKLHWQRFKTKLFTLSQGAVRRAFSYHTLPGGHFHKMFQEP